MPEIKQYQPGEKSYIWKSSQVEITPCTTRVRGTWDFHVQKFEFETYDKNGKLIIEKIF